MHDLLLKNAHIVDGTGAPAYGGDLVIDEGVVVDIVSPGTASGPARRVIDADGRAVTPGFVDAHTHLDGQLLWDPLGTPACWHGITTVLIGHCGVTFAPVKPDDRDALAAMLETVEDIPRDAIMNSLVWNWESYGQYLDALDAQPKGVNVAGLIGHAAVRYYAMGERSLDKDTEPTEGELAVMVELVREAIGAGAVGFSTSRTLTHRAPDRRPIPGTYASFDELSAFAQVLGDLGKGALQLIPRFMEGEKDMQRLPQTRRELSWMFDTSRRHGCPIVFSLFTHRATRGQPAKILDMLDELSATGGRVRPMAGLRAGTTLSSLHNFSPLTKMHPVWHELYALPYRERIAAVRDPAWRARLSSDDGPLNEYIGNDYFLFGPERCNYERDEALRVGVVAKAEGKRPIDVVIDRMAETHGEQIFAFATNNHDVDELEAIMDHPESLIGLGDAGAHVGYIADSSSTTYTLTHWHRDQGKYTIEEAVRRITSDAAEAFGIHDRGRLAVGMPADINVISMADLQIELPRYVHDFPCGSGRWTQKARGYDYTIVNGEVFVEDGHFTGALAGQLVRA